MVLLRVWCLSTLYPVFAQELFANACDKTVADESCVATWKQIEEHEHREVKGASVELLQKHQGPTNEGSHGSGGKSNVSIRGSDLDTYGGDHRYLLVRPCERFAGDGRSGLPRHRVTGMCCGDAMCSTDHYESFESCPSDCKKDTSSNTDSATKTLSSTHCTLFGDLAAMDHDEYHCEEEYELDGCGCSCSPHRKSKWLEDLLDRKNKGTLPFDLPGPGAIAVEFGAGEGQDTRNMAELAGYTVTGIDVSPTGIAIAKNLTEPEMLGNGPGQIEFIAYDATALPEPKKRVDFLFDATVYCGLRHLYLSKLYGVWSRIATPGHTLVNFQCWNEESNNYAAIPKTRRDMEADFEPLFDILHSESCMKNQFGTGWCFYMKMKAPEVRSTLFAKRLKMQIAVRDGDFEVVREGLRKDSESLPNAEIMTLYYIAQSQWNLKLMTYLRSLLPDSDDPFLKTAYGRNALAETIKAEDQVEESKGMRARLEQRYLKADWERAESQLILQGRIEQLEGNNTAS